MVIRTVSAPFFMLVQDGEVLDCCQNPNALMWTLLNDDADFSVAVGVINEEGTREIVGTCAEFKTKPDSTIAYLTSDMDGYRRLVSKGDAADCIRNRVCMLFGAGRLADPCNFSKVEMVEGCRA
jgi:hypothetical protein